MNKSPFASGEGIFFDSREIALSAVMSFFAATA